MGKIPTFYEFIILRERKMKTIRFISFLVVLTLGLSAPIARAEDLNDVAYGDRIHLNAGTIWNYQGNGDCLIFPYYDVRHVGDKSQITNINIENFGAYGIAAKLRFRDWARGREVFSKDIWIPSKTIWNAKVEINEDGTNAIITSSGNVIWRNDSSTFYFGNPLLNGVPFSTKNLRTGRGESTLCGFIEVIGEEKTSPDDAGGKAGRLAPSEQDCPNTLRGTLSITRVEDGTTMAYEAVAIGNFSRNQGSLFRSPGSPYPRLDNCEDTVDQLEFQLSKWEIFGPFSVSPSNQGKTSLILTFPTKYLHYSNGRRINKNNNPFEAPLENQGETLKTSLSTTQGSPLPVGSEITLPFSVNVIGLYQGSDTPHQGIDNLSLPIFSYESGEVKLTSNGMAQCILIQDYEYLREMFSTYRGLPALGLIVQEYRDPDVLHATIMPAEFSAVWEATTQESILFPTFVSGPSFGQVNTEYTYTTGGASSTIGHPIQYLFDWGDGTNSGWLDVGVTSAKKTWTAGGIYAVRSKARCAIHTSLESKWSNNFTVTIESVSPPSILNGPVVGLPNTSYTYTTGGSVSSIGHPVQYFFDWGDGTDSNWLPAGVTTATKSWTKGGSYNVTAKARCATDPSVISGLTPALVVKIEIISTPATPLGPDKGLPGDTFTYMTGGASSNINDPVQYQIDWAGDGFSDLSSWQSSTAFTKTWAKGGTFHVRARARCTIHTSVMSDWSSPFTVNIEKISTPTIPTQQPTGVGAPGSSFTYATGGAASNIGDPVQYFIDFGDGTNSGWLPVGTTSCPKTWFFQGTFNVRAKARCAIHTQVESDWSQVLEVEIETVTVPNTPTSSDLPLNPNPPPPDRIGVMNTSYNFSTNGAVSNLDHPVEYQFDWGDGTQSQWITPGTDGIATTQHKYTKTGPYSVTAKARCKTDPTIMSIRSGALAVKIN
jgi:hypothetical protein